MRFLKTHRILLPEQVVQEDAHGIHAHRFRPAEFLVDLDRIEGRRLPHLQLIDRRRGHVIAADQPWLLRVPGIRLLLRPAGGLRRGSSRAADCDQCCRGEGV